MGLVSQELIWVTKKYPSNQMFSDPASFLWVIYLTSKIIFISIGKITIINNTQIYDTIKKSNTSHRILKSTKYRLMKLKLKPKGISLEIEGF